MLTELQRGTPVAADQTFAILNALRFRGDVSDLQRMERDEGMASLLQAAMSEGAVEAYRAQLLAHAVRVEPSMLPDLSRAIRQIAERCRISKPLETYVYAGPDINAGITECEERFIVALSSAAIEKLRAEELEFIIGHEIGHISYGHLDVPVNALLSGQYSVDARQAMQLRAWQRKAEISADRSGLVCCGSLDTAVTTLFKTLSGLSLENLTVDTAEFAAQWDHLAQHHISDGRGSHWNISHPFPPLRVKALMYFWECDEAVTHIPDAVGGRTAQEADHEIETLLAMMDPLARRSGEGSDPLLQPFILWGGLYLALISGDAEGVEVERLQSLLGGEAVKREMAGGFPGPQACRERFVQALSSRKSPLTALDLRRIFTAIGSIAGADGTVCDQERAALSDLATVCGISPCFVESLVSQQAA